jgi:hypothetical protein
VCVPPDPPNWEPVREPKLVYRFVKQSDPGAEGFSDNFMSDEERGKTPVPDEHPDLLTGMSAFISEEKARKRWAEIKAEALKKRSERNRRRQRPLRMSVGDYIAEVLLGPGGDFEVVDTGAPDGHLTIRGDKDQLADRVRRVYPAESTPT